MLVILWLILESISLFFYYLARLAKISGPLVTYRQGKERMFLLFLILNGIVEYAYYVLKGLTFLVYCMGNKPAAAWAKAGEIIK